MAINFSDKVLITNPTIYHLGKGILVAGILVIGVGLITYFVGSDVILPAMAWCAFGPPMIVIGVVLRRNGLTRN